MADYINIRGQSIEVVASDPANPTARTDLVQLNF
jgi:hypothetical protein